ncbi:MAG TPA: aldo/keto reductase [Pedobacter sp.]|nr:aldo/keto reductase [Pedobacter sp.]
MSELIISRLGFGMSGIAGSGNSAHQQRLVKTAIDYGITHFDVAPFYGSGDAEKILGDILRSCPETVTITTKFGLHPVKVPGRLRSIARPILRRMSGLKTLAVKLVSYGHSPDLQKFNPGDLLNSAEASMRKLGRPANIFLLHDVAQGLAESEPVVTELQQLKASGFSTLTGVSGSERELKNLCVAYPGVYSFVQLENSLTSHADTSFFTANEARCITHRAILGGYQELNSLFRFRPGFRQIWNREIGIDIANHDNLTQILLELALSENINGSVLFSTTNPGRIKIAAAAIQNPLLSTVQCQRMRMLFQDVYLHPIDRKV